VEDGTDQGGQDGWMDPVGNGGEGRARALNLKSPFFFLFFHVCSGGLIPRDSRTAHAKVEGFLCLPFVVVLDMDGGSTYHLGITRPYQK